jgi:hypothetical protein
MKIALSVITATVVPFGFVVLAVAGVGYLLSKRREAGARVASAAGTAEQSAAAAA